MPIILRGPISIASHQRRTPLLPLPQSSIFISLPDSRNSSQTHTVAAPRISINPPPVRDWHPDYVLSQLAGILTTVRFRASKISTVHPSPSDRTSMRRPGY
ncbi:hypothetical protein AAC387_Pa09g0348 [Persea americana]